MSVRTATTEKRHGHLVVHSVNAAGGQKSVYPTELAINLADHDKEKADIILMQEPWAGLPPERMAVKTHPNYNVYSPVDAWDKTKGPNLCKEAPTSRPDAPLRN